MSDSARLKARSDETRAKSLKTPNAPRVTSRSKKAQESRRLKYLLLCSVVYGGCSGCWVMSDNEVPCSVFRKRICPISTGLLSAVASGCFSGLKYYHKDTWIQSCVIRVFMYLCTWNIPADWSGLGGLSGCFCYVFTNGSGMMSFTPFYNLTTFWFSCLFFTQADKTKHVYSVFLEKVKLSP